MDDHGPGIPTDRLLAVIRALSFCRTHADVMAIFRQHARQLTGADGMTFVVRDADQCYYAEEDAIGPLWKGRRFPMTACISGWVMLNRQAALIDDIYRDPRIPLAAYRPTFVKSLAMVPVRSDDPLGAIGAYWATNHVASPNEVRVLQVIADASALALENVRLYESLQAALDRAEALNRAKDEWISVVSHELRTPLTPILGWARMLGAGQVPPNRQVHACEVIERNVMSEIRIVDDLLDVSRLMTGRLPVTPQPVDLRDLVSKAADQVRPSAAQKGVTLHVALPAAPLPVLADARRLQQAVSSLLTNAITFTPPGGEVALDAAPTETGVRIRVTDTGDGIEAGALPGLFQAFARADQSINRTNGGLGLGLYLARQIVELLGGTIAASSDGPGLGATFVITLPAHHPAILAPDAAPAAREEAADLSGLRVLVVDDDCDTLELLQQCLERCGADVSTASNADQAIALSTAAPFDAIVSDLAMPQQNGYQMLARLREVDSPGRLVPVVALTAHATPDDERRALGAGFQMYLSKPVTPATLADSVRVVVDQAPGRAVAH